MTKTCEECGKPFETVYSWAIICDECCFLPDEKICFESLHLGESFMECEWAAKGHAQPHRWRGEIDGKMVVVEWLDKAKQEGPKA